MMEPIVAPPPPVAAFKLMVPAFPPFAPTVWTQMCSMKQMFVATVLTGVVPLRVTVSEKGPLRFWSKYVILTVRAPVPAEVSFASVDTKERWALDDCSVYVDAKIAVLVVPT